MLLKAHESWFVTSRAFPHLGKLDSQKQSEAKPGPQTCSSFEYANDSMATEQLPGWKSEDSTTETQVRGSLVRGSQPPLAPS